MLNKFATKDMHFVTILWFKYWNCGNHFLITLFANIVLYVLTELKLGSFFHRFCRQLHQTKPIRLIFLYQKGKKRNNNGLLAHLKKFLLN